MTRVTKMYFSIVFLLLLSVNNSYSQKSGIRLFDNAIVHEIKLGFEQSDYWNQLTSNYDSYQAGGESVYILASVNIDGTDIDSVGVRLKGFTSYSSSEVKKPIKIDFNEFVSGQKYDGLKKLNLANGTADPSLQRDVVCYDMLRFAGVSAPRTSFSKVYINDEYWGLYQNIEQVDQTFLNNNFSNTDGNLFKNSGWNNLDWLGADDSNYHPPYVLKTNRDSADWSGLVNLFDVLNNTSDDEFATQIQTVFNVDDYLKILAIDVATNNWDSNLEHGRNWYLYEDIKTGLFHWIPWDYNLSFGGQLDFGPGGDECNTFVSFSSSNITNKQVEFMDESFYNGSATYFWNFGDGNTSTEKNPIHDYETNGKYEVCLTITTSVDCERLGCEQIDTDYRLEDCPSIVDGTCTHPVDQILASLINWYPECCDEWSESCEVNYQLFYDWFGNGSGNNEGPDFTIAQSSSERILINRLLNVPEFKTSYYGHFCNLLDYNMTEDRLFELLDNNYTLIKDAVEEDPNYLYTFEKFLEEASAENDTTGFQSLIKKRIGSLIGDLDTLYSCSPVANLDWHDIVINEFVALNDSTSSISDVAGEHEDWIEIYNNTAEVLDLSNVHLSDDISKLNKWKFTPGTIIAANGYLIVWADKDEEQDGIHANFKLNKSGEQLVLSNLDGSIVDSLSFGEQNANISLARKPNGTGDFIFQDNTFNQSNDYVGSVDISTPLAFSIQPNPVSDYLNIIVKESSVKDLYYKVYAGTGQFIKMEKITNASFKIEVESWINGLYIVQIIDNNGNIKSMKFIVSH